MESDLEYYRGALDRKLDLIGELRQELGKRPKFNGEMQALLKIIDELDPDMIEEAQIVACERGLGPDEIYPRRLQDQAFLTDQQMIDRAAMNTWVQGISAQAAPANIYRGATGFNANFINQLLGTANQ